MDTSLPTGFILVVLPIAWLAIQMLCWWGLSRLVPQPAHLQSCPDQPRLGADRAPQHS